MGFAGPGFGFWLTGKPHRAWVVHGIGARCLLGGRGHGVFSLGLGYPCDVING